MEDPSKATSYRLLCISDTHLAFDKLSRVGNLVLQHECDAVLLTGDLGNYHHERPHIITEMQAEYDMDQVLKLVEQGHEKPVFFLPGNHDAPSTLQVPSLCKLGTRALNLHGQSRVPTSREGLFFCGLGGSVPATQSGYEVWTGFPYTEQKLGDALALMWNRSLALAQVGDYFVLATHVGPFGVSTSVSLKDTTRDGIESGSTNVRRTLQSEEGQKNLVCHIHGHTHDGWGVGQVGGVSVVNPGALVVGRYAIVTLSKAATGAWHMKSVSFETMAP